jgi:hypothetical protein
MPFLHSVRDIVVKDRAIPRTQKGQTFRKRHQTKLEGISERLKEATTSEEGEDL